MPPCARRSTSALRTPPAGRRSSALVLGVGHRLAAAPAGAHRRAARSSACSRRPQRSSIHAPARGAKHLGELARAARRARRGRGSADSCPRSTGHCRARRTTSSSSASHTLPSSSSASPTMTTKRSGVRGAAVIGEIARGEGAERGRDRARAPSSRSRDRPPPGSCAGSDRPADRRRSRSACRSLGGRAGRAGTGWRRRRARRGPSRATTSVRRAASWK